MILPVKTRPILLYVHEKADDAYTFEWARVNGSVKFRLQLVNGFYEGVDYLLAQGKFAALSKESKPAIILVDYSLGTHKGTDLLRWLHQQADLMSLPVVVFGRSTEPYQMAECYVAGADYYLVKPDSFEGLEKIVRCFEQCLEQRPPTLRALREVSAHPELAQNHKTAAAKLDAAMAEQKERKKKIPFVRRKLKRTQELNREIL
jgi:DNA-binding response OmpR family regulator